MNEDEYLEFINKQNIETEIRNMLSTLYTPKKNKRLEIDASKDEIASYIRDMKDWIIEYIIYRYINF